MYGLRFNKWICLTEVNIMFLFFQNVLMVMMPKMMYEPLSNTVKLNLEVHICCYSCCFLIVCVVLFLLVYLFLFFVLVSKIKELSYIHTRCQKSSQQEKTPQDIWTVIHIANLSFCKTLSVLLNFICDE